MNISYDLWPIWCDYLEEQSYDTELLRYVLTWGINISNRSEYIYTIMFRNYGIQSPFYDDAKYYGHGFTYTSWFCVPQNGNGFSVFFGDGFLGYFGSGSAIY